MRTFEMESPNGTGLVVELRTFKLKDTSSLLKAKGSEMQQKLFDLLNVCTIRVISLGIYSKQMTTDSFSWENTYEGDWFAAMLRIRSETYGSKYDVEASCPRCEEVTHGAIDIDSLIVGKVSDYLKSELVEGRNIQERTIEDLGTFKIRIPTGKESILLTKERRLLGKGSIETIEEGLDFRIVEIEGVPTKDKLTWLEEMDADKASLLLEVIDGYSFGIDTTAEIPCSYCRFHIEEDVKFDTSFFRLTPKKKRRKR